MSLRLLSVVAAAVLVAACSSDPENTGTGTSAGGGSGSGMTSSAVRPGSQEDLVANVGDRVFFDTDRSTIRPDGRATLDKQSAWLKQNPSTTITVEGHADERGTREYNLALGNRRATAVKNYLVATGINANRITTISYGKERPAVVGSNEQAWSQNRRGVSVVTSSQAGS